MTLLVAGSPVEILAEADELGLDAESRTVASALFHDLTSRLELDLLAADADGGEPWPKHRFWFGEAAEVEALAERLRALPDVAEPPAKAGIVFEVRQSGRWGGLLAAGAGPGWADRLG